MNKKPDVQVAKQAVAAPFRVRNMLLAAVICFAFIVTQFDFAWAQALAQNLPVPANEVTRDVEDGSSIYGSVTLPVVTPEEGLNMLLERELQKEVLERQI